MTHNLKDSTKKYIKRVLSVIKFKNLKKFIPIAQIYPRNTFVKRSCIKFMWIKKYITGQIKAQIGLSGGKIYGQTPLGNYYLKMNKSYPVGDKGSIICIPYDKTIFSNVKLWGEWDFHHSFFVSEALKDAKLREGKVVLIDIGAHCGLVTLQALNLSKSDCDVYLFEPHPLHVEALRFNLGKKANLNNIHIQDFALSDRNGIATFFTEKSNRGNTSIYSKLVGSQTRDKLKIKIVNTEEYFKERLNNYSNIIIKSDTEGQDSIVLSNLSQNIWRLVDLAVIEVWAHEEVVKNDVERLTRIWYDLKFEFFWITKSGNLILSSLTEVKNFWISGNNSQKNILVKKPA